MTDFFAALCVFIISSMRLVIDRSACLLGFPCGSAGKESACNVGDLCSVPGLRRSPGEGKGYPLQYSGLSTSHSCMKQFISNSEDGYWCS